VLLVVPLNAPDESVSCLERAKQLMNKTEMKHDISRSHHSELQFGGGDLKHGSGE
jgi:hypothetical protein